MVGKIAQQYSEYNLTKGHFHHLSFQNVVPAKFKKKIDQGGRVFISKKSSRQLVALFLPLSIKVDHLSLADFPRVMMHLNCELQLAVLIF